MLIALKNTGIMIIATIVGEVGLAIVLSLLVSNIKKGAGFFRVVYFFPIVISATALGLLFNLVFLYDKGMINQLLQLIGVLDAGKNELIDWKATHPMFTMLVPVIWQYVGFYFIILLTGLSGIPEDLYEAAEIDGASKWQVYQKITLPLIKPTIIYITITSIIGGMQLFDVPATMSDGTGEPDKAILTTAMYLYNQGFKNHNYGYSAAISVGLFVIIGFMSFISLRVMKGKEKNYG